MLICFDGFSAQRLCNRTVEKSIPVTFCISKLFPNHLSAQGRQLHMCQINLTSPLRSLKCHFVKMKSATNLEPFQSCVLLLTPPLVGAHVEMGKRHLENCICNSELVVLGDSHNVHVPHQHEGEGGDDADEDVDGGVDDGVGVLGEAGRVAREEVGSRWADLEEGRQRGGEDQHPGEKEEEKSSSAG